MKSQPLTDTELDQLSTILARFGDKHSMNLEQLDGYLAALICGPELVPPRSIFPRFGATKRSLRIHLLHKYLCHSSCVIGMLSPIR